MPRKMLGPLLAASIAASALLVQLAPGAPVILRAALALPLVFYLPGYVLVRAAFPQGSQPLAEQQLYRVGVSMLVTALGGFALHWTPWGLQAASWALLLAGVTLAGCAGALLPARVPSERAAAYSLRPSLRQAALFSLAIVVTVSAVSISAVGAQQPRSPGFTQLWATPGAAPGELQLGVENQEQMQVAYIVRIEAQGRVLQSWPAISLNAGERWQVPAKLSGELLALPDVSLVLYRQDAPDRVYRHVALLPMGEK